MVKILFIALGMALSGHGLAQSTSEISQLKSIVAVQQAQIARLSSQLQTQQVQITNQQTQFNNKVDSLNQTACKRTYNPADLGYADDFRGWYNVDGCIVYCRWVGNSASGGDPQRGTTYGQSLWSCADGGEYRQFPTFNYHLIAKYSR